MRPVPASVASTSPATSRRRLPAALWLRSGRAVVAVAALGIAAGGAGSALAQPNDEPRLVRPVFVQYGGEGTASAIRSPLGIALDVRRGEIVLANTQQHRIEIFSLSGSARGGFIHRVERPDGSIVDGLPAGVAVDSHGHLLVVDRFDRCVALLDFLGRRVGELCLPAQPAAAGDSSESPPALAVATAPDGSIYVAGGGLEPRIHRFDAEHRHVAAWGDPGRGPGQLTAVTALAVAPSGEVVVLTSGTELCVQRFSAEGEYLGGFGLHEIGPGNFSFPSGVAVTADGRIWVTDGIRQNLQVFSGDGKYIAALGTPGTRAGQFLFPSGVATDGTRYLAVSERGGRRLQLLEILAVNDSETSAPERR